LSIAEALYPRTGFSRDIWDRCLVIAIFAGIWGSFFAAFAGGLFDPVIAAASSGTWSAVLWRPSILWFLMGMLLLTLRTVLWTRYREAPPAAFDQAPLITVVIPAYNEGAMVQKTIDSCAAAHYPRGRLQIIAVDDGSRDDTWEHIQAAASRHGSLVVAVRLERNQGKRAALAEGFRRASGEVIVTVDSDSLIEPQTLLALAGPFADPRVGAVAGKVSVLNRHRGWLPRMLHVRFTLSFDFLRSVQSTYRTVFCCPGALAAYRASLVRQVMPAWLNQRFLGAPCTIGEDRALTNDILALGYDTVFQRSAVVHTLVPETYSRLCRMYLRWERSYIREELRLARIIWTRPKGALWISLLEHTVTNLRYPVAWAVIALFVSRALEDPHTLVRMLISIGVAATLYALYYLRSERSWCFVYGIVYAYFSFFLLFWIFPFALITARARGWMTR
jgi:hyaluronan synthase